MTTEYESFLRAQPAWKRMLPFSKNKDDPEQRPVASSADCLPISSTPPDAILSSVSSKQPLQPRPRLLDSRTSASGIERFGLPHGTMYLYWTDLFHTLLNMPRYRFILVFFTVYVTMFILFALLYLACTDECVVGIRRFDHALWFSVQTAATIGYGGKLTPNEDCVGVNVLVMIQVICAALLDYCMMGLVFARFAAPHRRTQTIRFSKSAVVCKQKSVDGGPNYWALTLRIANIRKHNLIKPDIQLLLAIPDKDQPSSFYFQPLEIEHYGTQIANVKLGLPAHVSHVIRPDSPMWNMSVAELDVKDIDVVCFMEGVDSMTSNSIQAQYAYTPGDIRMNERLAPLPVKQRKGKLGVDFLPFDQTVQADILGDEGFGNTKPGESPMVLRNNTFESLTVGAAAAAIAGQVVEVPLSGSPSRASGSNNRTASPARHSNPFSQQPVSRTASAARSNIANS